MKFLTYTILSLFLLLSFTAKAQNAFSVKGTVADTTSAVKLHNASVLVLRAKDSIMVKYSRVSQEGNFAINNLPGGKYLLLVTYPEYADYSEPFTLDATTTAKEFGRISMILKAKLLQDIVIKGKATAIKIKGDTTVFNASAFVVQPNAKVEDLMKQFPGVTVDKDGKITANGQTVTKMLLGGEEFFGDDPTLITKNIRADMAKEVQMFEKKSDQAAFTGIDDGKKTLTMNVVLKDDKKSGYFGKVDVGVGTNGFYSGQAMYNKFKNKEKFAFNTTLSNNGRTGLSFQDEQKYGDAGTITVMDGGGIAIMLSGNELNYDGRGFPIARSGGLHYDNKWGAKDKYTINSNYKIGHLEVEGTSQGTNINDLGTQINTTISNQRFANSGLRQKVDVAAVIAIDSVTNLKITADGSLRNSTQYNESDQTIYNGDKIQNRSTSKNYIQTDQKVFNASAFYTKKLKKKGRTISLLLGTTLDEAERDESLKTTADTYDATTGNIIPALSRVVDQKKPGSSKSTAFNSNFTYTEPFTQSLSLIVNYGLNLNSATSKRLAYNNSGAGQYDVLDPMVSNSFKLNQLAHQGGAILNYVKGKTTVNFGTRITDVQFKQDNELKGDIFERHFINWMPQATYQYRFGQQSVFNFNYSGNTQQPSISQLQPVLDNTNPYFQNIGNDQLKPAFSNRFSLYYTNYKPLSGQRFYISGGYNFTSNAFVSNTTTILDGPNQGRTISQTVNTSEKTPYNYNLSVNYGRNIWGGVQAGLTASTSNSISFNQVTRESQIDPTKTTSTLNQSESGNYSINFSLSKYAANKYDLYISGGPMYSIRKSTIQTQNNNSKDFRGNAYFGYYLPAKFQITSEATYQYTGATNGLDGFSRTIVTATLSKMFLKSNALKVTASANDLLNQNTGFSRNINGNQVNQNTNTTIRRYFMLSVSWDFNKMGGGATPKQ